MVKTSRHTKINSIGNKLIVSFFFLTFLDDPNAPIIQTLLSSQKMEPGATALLVVSLIVLFVVLTFGLALLISKRRKRGKLIEENPDLEYSKLMST